MYKFFYAYEVWLGILFICLLADDSIGLFMSSCLQALSNESLNAQQLSILAIDSYFHLSMRRFLCFSFPSMVETNVFIFLSSIGIGYWWQTHWFQVCMVSQIFFMLKNPNFKQIISLDAPCEWLYTGPYNL